MRNDGAINLPRGEVSPDQRIGEFQHVLNNWETQNPQGFDSRYATGARVVAEALSISNVREVFREVLEARANRRPEPYLYVGELAMRVFNMLAQPYKHELNWPHAFTAKEPWQEFVREAVSPQGDLLGDLMVRMSYDEVQSNPPGRAIWPAIVAMLYKHRFGSDPPLADVGASMNHIPNALWHPVNTLTGVGVSKDERSTEKEKAELRRILGWVATNDHRPSFGSPTTGFEVKDMIYDEHDTKTWDPHKRLWVKVNTIRPDEEVDYPEVVEEYDLIDKFRSDEVEFVRADFTTPTDELLQVVGDKRYDIVNVSAMIHQYQGQPEIVRRILSNCKALATPWGVISVLEYGEPVENQPGRIRLFQNRLPYSFRGLVYDVLQPELGFQEIVQFKSGRCKDVVPGRDWSTVAMNVGQLAS